MYKVLVAEKDAVSAEEITSLIETKIQNAKVVAVTNSGNDTIVDTINSEPDLILIGIEIAGMNGIETVRKIRRFNKSVRIIIVSAYDYFEFAREAMILGVNDYILKPINQMELVKAIERELQAVKEEDDIEREYKDEENQYSNALRYVEQHFIFSVSYNMNVDAEIHQYQKLLGIGSKGYIMSVSVEPNVLNKHWNMEKAAGRIYRRLKEVVNAHSSCAVGPRMLNRYTIYVTSDKERESKEAQLESITLAKEILRVLKETFDLEVKIAIGGIRTIVNIHDSYLEMLRSCRYDVESPIVHYKEVRYKYNMKESYMELTDQLIDSIKYNRYNAEEGLSNILELLRPMEVTERLTSMIEVLTCISYAFRKELKNQDIYYDYVKQCDKLLYLSLEEQEAWVYRRLHTMVKLMRSGKKARRSNVVTIAMEYIQKNYTQEISLNEISQYVGLSPQHFSKIFKETTNYSYVEWVNDLRIGKAQEIMKQEDCTIKEVCFLVGFQDPNYFSRIFKKRVGISPTEYAKERAI
ncbi:MAG: AraC family transcriptional regulator [bacterium]|nr:AraC family transcriptional regulator [bacterium]